MIIFVSYELVGELQVRRKKPMDFQFTHQTTGMSTTRIDVDTSNKLKKIMKLSGLLKLNGVEYKTDIKDLEDLGELGNGTSGHVVKMRHKASNTFIAVKVSCVFSTTKLCFKI